MMRPFHPSEMTHMVCGKASRAPRVPHIDPGQWGHSLVCCILHAPVPGKLEDPMHASDIMSHPVVTVASDTTVAELARTMVEKQLGAVPLWNTKP